MCIYAAYLLAKYENIDEIREASAIYAIQLRSITVLITNTTLKEIL